MSQAEDRTPDQVIDGRYRILRKVAEGGMATVYEALDQRLSRHVAVKVMHTQLAQGPHRVQFEERFRREAQSAAAIANPHIVQVYDTGVFKGLDYLVMEYVHGVSLRQEMNQQEIFNLKETLRILGEILDGLSSAHQAGVIHRDIKPENILINDRGHVEITDFGLARASSQGTLSSTGMLLGTAAYLAPETIENNQATPQSDLYAVGIITYEMLSGKVPFASQNPVTIVFKHVHEDVPPLSQVCPGIDPAISALITRLTSRSPQNRPDDACQALDELKQAMRGLDRHDLQFIMPVSSLTDHSEEGQPGQPGEGNNDPAKRSPDTDSTQAMTPGGDPPAAPRPSSATSMVNRQEEAGGGQTPTDRQSETRRYLLNDLDTPSQGKQTEVMQPLVPLEGTGSLSSQASQPDQVVLGSDLINTGASAGTARKGRKNRRVLPLILLILLVLALVAGGGWGWWYYLGPGSYRTLPKPDDITCPQNQDCKVTGANFTTYKQTLKVAGIPFEAKYDFSDTVTKNAIISADPDTVGAHISTRRGNLKIRVSKGVRQVTIPQDLLNSSSPNGKDPLKTLEKEGFTQIIHDKSNDQYSMEVPEGAAISVDPAPGTRTRHDTRVTLVLSKGKMPVAMPDIVGKSKDEADTALKALRLQVNYSQDWSDKVPRDRVISASHKAQEELHWGDQVDVVISRGPQSITMPDVKGKSQEEATQILENMGLKVNISAPLGNLTHTVRIQDPNPGSQVRVIRDDGSPSVVTLTVV